MPRGYAKLVHELWTGDLGLYMRQDTVPTMHGLAPYLLGNAHSTMTGLYRLPVGFIAADLGWPIEGAWKTLRSLSEGGFVRYDEAREIIWVVEAFRHEFPTDRGTPEKPDNAAKGIPEILEPVRKSFLVREFLDRYLVTHPNLLAPCKGLRRGSEGAPPQGSGSSDQRAGIEEPPVSPPRTGDGPAPMEHERGGEGPTYSAPFLAFWESYPSKVGKGAAWKAWRRLRPTAELQTRMLAAVEAQRLTPRWRQGTIPHPATWLNGARWEDDPAALTAIENGGKRREEALPYVPQYLRPGQTLAEPWKPPPEDEEAPLEH